MRLGVYPIVYRVSFIWPNEIIFHQPRFPCNKGISLPKRYLFGCFWLCDDCDVDVKFDVMNSQITDGFFNQAMSP